MKHAYRLAVLLLTVLPSLPAAAAFQAFLERNQIEPGESVQLTLQRDGRGGEPDLAPLKQDFAILDAASGSSVQIINGHLSAQVTVRLTLSPKRTGQLQIPALTWEGERSPALTLTVTPTTGNTTSGNGDAAASTSTSHLFMTRTLDQQQPYVQAAATLTLRIHTDQPLYQAGLDLASSNDVVVQQLGKDRQSSETRDGRSYQVIERTYLLFPQRSGRISLPGPVLAGQVADPRAGPSSGDPFMNRAFGNLFGRDPFAGAMNAPRPFRLQGDPIVLDARARPASVSGQDWLPARQLSLEESWRPDGSTLRAGEPLTRHLRLSAVGLSAAQLPDLAARMPLPDEIKAYPDTPKLSSQEQGDSLKGVREQDIALIASRPGHYELPAMRVAWWDTEQNQAREVVLPARTLEVQPGVAGAGGERAGGPPATTASPSVPTAASGPRAGGTVMDGALPWTWISLTLGLGLLWLATLIAWWRARRQRPAAVVASAPPAPGMDTIHAGAARKAFRQACRDNDAVAARRHLLDWARTHWPLDAPAGLNALAQRLHDTRQATQVRALDRACYAGADWQGAPLAEALAVLPAEAAQPEGKTAELAGLYP